MCVNRGAHSLLFAQVGGSYHVYGLVFPNIHRKKAQRSGQSACTPTERLDVKSEFTHTLNRPRKPRPLVPVALQN